MKPNLLSLAAGLLALSLSCIHAAGTESARVLWLENLDLKMVKGSVRAAKTLEGKPITLGGIQYDHGLGSGDTLMLHIRLKQSAVRFEAVFNVDDSAIKRGGALRASVFVDGKLVFQTPRASGSGARKGPFPISVDLTGATDLMLVGMAEVRRSCLMDWADARLTLLPEAREMPEAAPMPEDLAQAFDSKSNALFLDQIYHAYIDSGYASPPGFGRTQTGEAILVNGAFYSRGVVVRPRSYIRLNLKGAATQFLAQVSVNDGSPGSADFRVTVDRKVVFDSLFMRAGDRPQAIDVNLAGATELELTVDGAEGDNADTAAYAVWLGARIAIKQGVDKGAFPQPELPEQNPMPIALIHDGPEPALHGPVIAGASPGFPFLFRVPASGEAPLAFSAENLPAGLTINPATGLLSGVMTNPVQQRCRIKVRNARGEAARDLTLVCAPHAMALTPPLGWNSWHQWAEKVDDGKIRAAADGMVAKGFAAHGFAYVNIDDHWEGPRAPDGTISADPNKFPDMKALGDYIHAQGLKFGIYSSPGETTCGGRPGSLNHEAQDAATWAGWGVDYLKYDGCSGNHLPDIGERWRLMRQCLDRTGRDIVYSSNSSRDPAAACQLWRTTTDIRNGWEAVNQFAFGHPVGSEKNAGPGRYNDPDMLVVGNPDALPTKAVRGLTRNEQITHITQWSMLAAPLLLGCNLPEADAFLVSLMCNDEVLAVDQDPLVRQGWRLRQDPPVAEGGGEIWVRPLFDGTTAVAFYNRTAKPIRVKVSWQEIGRTGAQPVRDCWLRQDLGSFSEGYEARVETHAAVLIKVGKSKN